MPLRYCVATTSPKTEIWFVSGVLNFAEHIGEAELAAWIEEKATFPNTMVDRITPATKECVKG